MEAGSVVSLRISCVTRCSKVSPRWPGAETEHGYELVEFLDQDDAFRARMVEQICHIETYREQVTADRASRTELGTKLRTEWINKFAEAFPDRKRQPALRLPLFDG